MIARLFSQAAPFLSPTREGRARLRAGVLIMGAVVGSGSGFLGTWMSPRVCAQRTVAQIDRSAERAAEIPDVLKHGDATADGKRSLGGSGEMIRFTMPPGARGVKGLRIHGSRYGTPQPPDEDFEITFLSADRQEILQTETAPYRLFKRGQSKWVRVLLPRTVDVPREFWVVLDFHAERTKGVYVSYDTSTHGEFSRIGLPGSERYKETDFHGDWMVQVLVAK